MHQNVCIGDMVIYMLPMLLGRTCDVQHNKVGIDIYNQSYIEQAEQHPTSSSEVKSHYRLIETSHEKRKFFSISGDLALKISAGLVDIRGAGDYLKETSRMDKSVEILIKMTYETVLEKISLQAKPLDYWHSLSKDTVGTHVVTSLLYGGEVFASVNFIAYDEKYIQDIHAEVSASFSKSDIFDLKAAGRLESLSHNLSSKAKMEIDYFATVPLHTVPTSIEGLKMLVTDFDNLVVKVNKRKGVAICAGLKPLSDFKKEFEFIKNEALQTSMEDMNHKLDNLIKAKISLKSLISSLPENVPEDYIHKVANFSDRLTSTLMDFHKVIGDLDLEKGPEQFESAMLAFETNSPVFGNNRYTREIKRLRADMPKTEDPDVPRGIYIRWGKRACGPHAKNILYIGYMSSFVQSGIGAGTEYQCLPENPEMHLDLGISSYRDESSLTSVRYKSLSVFNLKGKDVEDKVASCTVCESFMRPTVQMFPALQSCPLGWVEEYTGFIVSTRRMRARTEFICLDYDPEHHEIYAPLDRSDPVILPSKIGNEGLDPKVFHKDASVPCVVCSKQ